MCAALPEPATANVVCNLTSARGGTPANLLIVRTTMRIDHGTDGMSRNGCVHNFV